VDYTFDFKELVRRATVEGKPETTVKRPVATGSAETYTLQIEIAPEALMIRDAQGKELDRYPRADPRQPLGQFGFKGDVELVVREIK